MNQKLLAKLQQYLNHDQDAVRFVQAITEYFGEVDDIIDEKITEPEKILSVLMQATTIYSSRFYQRYCRELYGVILTLTNAYADSVRMEKSSEEWQRNFGDVLRTAGNDVILVVVGIVSGWQAMRDVSVLIREHSYQQHHTPDGQAI